MKKLLQPKRLISLLLIFVLLIGYALFAPTSSNAALITASKVQFGDSRPSATNVTYTVNFTFPSTSTLQCVQVKFANAADMTTPATSMTSGSAFTLSGGGLTQGNWTNYGSTNGTLEIFAASSQTPTATAATITWTGVTNSNVTNPSNIYAQITTFSTQASSGATCSGQVDQSNVMAEILTTGVTMTATVDPSLTFAVTNYGSAVNGSGSTGLVTTTATTVPFATIVAGTPKSGSQTLTTSTNASGGYSIYTRYSAQMANANSDLFRNNAGTPASAVSFDASSSQSSLAYTADGPGVTFGSNLWAGLTTSNTQIATRATAQNADAFHVEYKIQASNVQPPGAYSTVVIYTATPTY